MVYFTLQLNSNQPTFKYSFSQDFLDKKYELGLIKLDGSLKINNATFTMADKFSLL